MENEDLYFRKCDKYDYICATACGVIGGLVDVFLVGAPAGAGNGESILQTWTDEQVNNVTIRFAKKLGWKPKAGNQIQNAIAFLENTFKVNYDQTSLGGGVVGELLDLNTNHGIIDI